MHRHPFDLLMELESEHVRLDCAALHLARDEYPHVRLEAYLDKLDEIADAVAALRPGLAATLRYEAMRNVIVEKYGLCGNTADYYDPQNSYLNRVLDRGIGIPISLATIWVEVGRRLKWPVFGVGFPGHFLVRFDDPERYVLVDPFHDGRSLSLEDCRKMLARRFNGKVEFSSPFVEPVETRTILIRTLTNLRRIYLSTQDYPRLARVLARLVAAESSNGRHLQDLASVYCRMGDMRCAQACLALYLQALPGAADEPLVRRSLRRIEAALLARN